jgi:adenine-specific DNA-methyltransferase
MPLSFKQHIENLFKNSQNFSDSDKNLDIQKILESIEKIDIELIKILKDDEKAKKEFFTQIDDIYVLNQNKLIEFFTLNDYMKNGSYTCFSNKIGLIRKDNFIKKFDDVVLAFPHKDCVLEGGQTKDDDKKKEVFYNEILSSDEIDRLFEPKVLTNIKRYSKNGVEENCEIKDDDNLIIKGNNLIALHSLKKKFAGKVKLIYIDPPYNTGNDSFKYNDNFNHSTWLTFMKNRLEIAREFLSDDGFIFIHLDYNESHYLKVLMDEIFGKNSFVNEIIWRRKQATSYGKNKFGIVVDNIFLYAKTENFTLNQIYSKDDDNTQKYIKERFVFEDKNGRKYMKSPLVNSLYRPNLKYVFQGINPPKNGWLYSKEKMQEFFDNDELLIPDNEEARIYRKIYLDTYKGQSIQNLWTDISIVNPMAKEQTEFETGQKPEKLLERIIFSATNPNDLIMDYHLGSGTTCAVAHKMGRRYIGIEQMDYIEDIAVVRIKNVIDGEQGGISKAVNWNGGGDFVYAELKTIDTFKDVEIGALNKNMQYLPISEIEDDSYNIGKEEIAINKAFYGIENE